MDALITKMNSAAMSMTSSTEMIETLNQSSSCTTEEPGLSDDSMSSPPTVAVIGCGPGGMFFLHALATKRKQLEESGDEAGLRRLPLVTVFEKSHSPGGVWRSDRNAHMNQGKGEKMNKCINGKKKQGSQQYGVNQESEQDNQGQEQHTNMYEGLWINGIKDVMEFSDYTFEEHFKTSQPTYLPRKHVFEYMMARVTQHGDIFQDVCFNTTVESVRYDDDLEQFIIDTTNQTDGFTIKNTQHFDKCIWAAGINGKPKQPSEVTQKLANFKGQIVHSSQMDRLGNEKANTNCVRGKRILLIGDSYSGEDLALQCLKLGAEKIYITSRNSSGIAAYVKVWPGENTIEVLHYAQVKGVKGEGEEGGSNDGRSILVEAIYEDCPLELDCLEDISIVIFCTGYHPNSHFLEDRLWYGDHDESHVWRLEDVGIDTKSWKMKDNLLTEDLGHIEPSEELSKWSPFHYPTLYFSHLIDNPDMMIIHEQEGFPLMDIDVRVYGCLRYIMGEVTIPKKEEIEKQQLQSLLESMDDIDTRYEIDENYQRAYDIWCDVDDLWVHGGLNDKFRTYTKLWYLTYFRTLAREMDHANYPHNQIFDSNGSLNKCGKILLEACIEDDLSRYQNLTVDKEAMRWMTFRDTDPSPFRSYLTGIPSSRLKGKWLEIDDEGNCCAEGEQRTI